MAQAIQNQETNSESSNSSAGNNRMTLLKNHFNEKINAICPGSIEILDLTELNGQNVKFEGGEIYEMKFVVKLKFLKSGHVNSRMINSGDISEICRTAKVLQGPAVHDPYGSPNPPKDISAGTINQ